ncbi:MAG: hypothetical protein J7K90_01015 [Desulfuromusa sp.]|nr:hypothetical protein [Desulfuromusa sp.]
MDPYQKLQQENRQLHGELQRKNEELQKTQENFDNLVTRKTEILEIRNRILQISQGVLDVLPVVVFGIDPEQMIVHCNEYARDLFPYGVIGPLGNDRNEVFPPAVNLLIDRLEHERNPKGKIEIGQQRFRGEVRRLHETLSQGVVLILIPES